MTGAITWEVLAIIASAVGGAFIIWWRIEGRVEKARSEATIKAETAQATASMAREEIAEHRLHVAETYVSKQGHRESTEQIMTAIGSVKSAVEGTNTRIDKLFDNRPSSRQSRGS